MPTLLNIVTDPQGRARFVDLDLALHPEAGAPSVSVPIATSSAWVFSAPAGDGHPEQPEARRQLAVVLAGSCTVTASGETRICRPGDLLLVEDTVGAGHSSTTDEGCTVLMIALETAHAGDRNQLSHHIPEETS
jgi:quercetin dioxygenase-like cupin family protein